MEEVAAQLGIRMDNYAKYESGLRSPKSDRLTAIAQILGVSYNDLTIGVEREYIDLLQGHAMSAALGNVDTFECFTSDVESSAEVNDTIQRLYEDISEAFAANHTDFYNQYITAPDLAALITLYDNYWALLDDEAGQERSLTKMELDYYAGHLDDRTTAKLAFCIAVNNYLEQANDAGSILDEAEKFAVNITPLQFFAVKIFIPYLDLIVDALELCMNTNINDFVNAFLYSALAEFDEAIEE
jgi:transcriptional regulator with XRE-family HTH domain